MTSRVNALGLLAVGLVVCSAWATALAAEPVTIKTPDGKGADASIDMNKPTTNLGNGTGMMVMAQPAGGRKAYIRFDLSAMKDPIKGAVLYLTVVPNTGTNPDHTFNVFGLNDGEDDEWIEGDGGDDNKPENEITAKNAPGNSKGGGGPYDEQKKSGGGVDPAKTTFLGTIVVDNSNYRMNGKNAGVAFGSEAMVEFLQKDANKLATFIITRAKVSQQDIITFVTKENGKAQPPTLKVSSEPMEFPVQPKPTTAPASKPASQPASAPGAAATTQPAK